MMGSDSDEEILKLLRTTFSTKKSSDEQIASLFANHIKLDYNGSTGLRHVARIHGLPKICKAQLFQGLQKNTSKSRLVLAQTLKYCIKHDPKFASLKDISTILSSTADAADEIEYRSQLVLAICQLPATPDLSSKFSSIANINSTAKAAIAQLKIQSQDVGRQDLKTSVIQDTGGDDDELETDVQALGKPGGLKFNKFEIPKKQEAHAVRAQQISTQTSTESSSEKEQLLQLNLMNALNSRTKTIANNCVQETFPPEISSNESAQAWYRTTYAEVENLRSLATGGKAISSEDQNYLYSCLTGAQVCFSYRSTVNKMVARTFSAISKKQRLSKGNCSGLIQFLLKTDNQYNDKFRKAILETAQNCFARDSSYFTTENQNALTSFMNGRNHGDELKLFTFEILLDQKDDAKYVDVFKEAMKNILTRQKAVQYISLQSLNSSRVLELFDSKILKQLLEIVHDSDNSMELRIQVGEIVENYLEHDKTSELPFDALKKIMKSAKKEQVNSQFKACLIRMILKSFQKSKVSDIPDDMLNSLVELCFDPDMTVSSLVLIGIKGLCINRAVPNVELLAQKLLDEKKISEKDLLFTNVSDSDSEADEEDTVCISAIVAEILLRVKTFDWKNKKGLTNSTKTLGFCAQALESNPDKQTRILLSEFLYAALPYEEFPEMVLVRLKDFVEDSVSDVKMYSTLVLAKGVQELSSKVTFPIRTELLDSIVQIFAFEPIIFESKDFKDEINLHILTTLNTEAKKTDAVFTSKVFSLLEVLLSKETKKKSLMELVSILHAYFTSHQIGNHSKIPENVLQSLEALMYSSPDVVHAVESVFELTVLRGQAVGPAVLQRIFDRLFLNDDNRENLFNLIIAANRNQELPDHLFSIFIMELVSSALKLLENDRKSVFKYLENALCKGQRLTSATANALAELISASVEILQSLKCLTISAQNGQSVSSQSFTALESKLKETWNYQEQFLTFCYSVLKNNQPLSESLSSSVLQHFENSKQVDDQLLDIIILSAQQGSHLTNKTVQRVCKVLGENIAETDRILSILLSSIKYIQDTDTLNCLCEVFVGHVEHETWTSRLLQGIQKIHELNLNFKLNENQINLLVDLAKRGSASNSFLVLKSIFQKYNLNSDQSQAVTFSEIMCSELDETFLFELFYFLESSEEGAGNYLKKCVERLDEILTTNLRLSEGHAIIRDGLNLIKKYFVCDEAPAMLLETIGAILTSTADEEAQKLSQELILQFAKTTSATFSKTLISKLESNFENSKEILQVLTTKAYKLSEQTQFLLNLDHLQDSSDTDTEETLKNISQKLDLCFELNSESAISILKIKSESVQFVEVLSKLVISGNRDIDIPKHHKRRIALHLMKEDAVQLHCIYQAFDILLREDTYDQLFTGLDERNTCEAALVRNFHSVGNSKIQRAILICLAGICFKQTDMSEESINIFLNNLGGKHLLVRFICFNILRDKQPDNSTFMEFVSNLVKGINQQVPPPGLFASELSQLTDLDFDILTALLSVETWDLNKLAHLSKNYWKKEIILSNFVAQLTRNPTEKLRLLDKLTHLFETHQDEEQQCMLLVVLTQIVRMQELNLAAIISVIDSMHLLDNNEILTHCNFIELTIENIKTLETKAIEKLLGTKAKLDTRRKAKLAAKLFNSMGIDMSLQLLQHLEQVDNIFNFEEVLNLISNFGVTSLDLQPDVTLNIHQLKLLVEKQILRRTLLKHKLNYSSKNDATRLEAILASLLQKNVSFETLITILNLGIETKSDSTPVALEFLFKISLEYKLTEKQLGKIIEALQEIKVESWIPAINKLVIDFHKSGKGLKSVTDVVSDMSRSLLHNPDLLELIRISELESTIDMIKSGQAESQFLEFAEFGQFQRWNKTEILAWAKSTKLKFGRLELSINYEFSVEALAVAKRAFFLTTRYELTNVQIISILVGLNKGLKGQLQQVATGSGKSTIVAILAVINALVHKGVDIYTSSPVLAERDARSWAGFYALFNLTCSHNGDSGTYLRGPKPCYTSDIVYGETSMFQFDYLRHAYSNLGTRGIRHFHFSIVDEVDSMLVDDLSKLARLSSVLPGMDLLQILYHLTWHRLVSIEQKLFTVGSMTYFVQGKIQYDEQNVAFLEFAEEKTGVIQIVKDLVKFIQLGHDLSKAGITLVEDMDQFIQTHLNEFLTAITSDKKVEGFDVSNDNRIKIPKNLQLFVNNQIPKWVESCITAFIYEENVHYIVDEGQIKPVDYSTTGVVQSSTAWSGGLHQFLQIKHGLKITSETVTTNFLSNFSLFKKYHRKLRVCHLEHFEFNEYNIIGFTGTLGSAHTRETLNTLYNVNCVDMPQSHFQRYVQYPDTIVRTQSDWLKSILRSVKFERKRGRGILIICETIKEAMSVAAIIKAQRPPINIRLYTQNNANQEDQIERISPGDVFIATNLAGRGTDIETDKIEAAGGLHVILSFLPANIRVEEQAFGRTSRQGKLGSGELICVSLVSESGESLRGARDSQQQVILESFLQNEFVIVQAKDKCFAGFCKFLNQIRKDFRSSDSLWTKTKAFFGSFTEPTVLELNVLQSIEERWAMFLTQLDDAKIPISQAWGYYKFFELKIKLDLAKTTRVIRSPFYHVVIGNDYLIRDSKWSNRLTDAKTHFESAIKLDPDFAGSAYIGLGFILLKGTLNVVQSDKYETDYKTKAIRMLRKALDLLNSESVHLLTAHSLYQTRGGSGDSDLFGQLTMKQNILNSVISCIDSTINTAISSLRRVDIIAQNSETMEEAEGPFSDRPSFTDNVSKSCISVCSELAGKGFDKFNLTFNDLTVRQDSGARDQAVKSIENLCEDPDIMIRAKSVGYQNMLSILKPSKYALGLSKGSALACIETWNEEAKTFMKLKTNEIGVFIGLEPEIPTEVEDAKPYNYEQAKKRVQTFDENAMVNLVLKSGNKETYKIFKEIEIDLDVSEMNLNSANLLLSKCKGALKFKLTVELSKAEPAALQKAEKEAENIEIRTITAENDETWTTRPIEISSVKSDTEIARVCFQELTWANIKYIVKQFPTAKFAITIEKFNKNISVSDILSLKSVLQTANLHFQVSQYKQIIPAIRKLGCKLEIAYRDLSLDQVEWALGNADLEQENITLSKSKVTNDLFASQYTPVTELWEFSLRGILLLWEFNEKAFVPWISIGCVLGLAAVQFGIGTALICTGFGATVGMGFITEGAADVFTAYRAYSSRQFSWQDYGKQKAVSLVISAVSMGWSKLKDAGKGVKTLTEGVTSKGVGTFTVNEIGYTEVIANSGKDLHGLAAKQIGVALGEAAAREALNTIVSMGSALVMEEMKASVAKTVEQRIIEKFHANTKLTQLVGFFWALDELSKTKELSKKINTIVAEATNPKSNFWTSQWNSIGGPLVNGVLSSSQSYGSLVSWSFRIAGILNGLWEISSVIQNVADAIAQKLQTEVRNMSPAYLLRYYCHRELSEADGKEITMNVDAITFNLGSTKNKDVSKFFKSLESQQKKFEMKHISMILGSMTNALTEHILKIADSQMRAPITTFLVGKGVANLSAYVQTHFIVNSEQSTKELDGKSRVTVADQINAKAKEYTNAYQLQAIYAKISQMTENGTNGDNQSAKPSEKVLEAVTGIVNGKPASFTIMAVLAKQKGFDLNLVDPDFVFQPDKNRDPNKVFVVYEPGEVDPKTGLRGIGHYSKLNPVTGQKIEIESTREDCGYAVVTSITGEKVTEQNILELRVKAAGFLLNNADAFERVLEDEDWVRSHDPKEANALLFVGGLSPNFPEHRQETTTQFHDGREYTVVKKLCAIVGIDEVGKNKPIKSLNDLLKILQAADPDNKGKYVRAHGITAQKNGPDEAQNLFMTTKSVNALDSFYNEQPGIKFCLNEIKENQTSDAELIVRRVFGYDETNPNVQPIQSVTTSVGLKNASPEQMQRFKAAYQEHVNNGHGTFVETKETKRIEFRSTIRQPNVNEPAEITPWDSSDPNEALSESSEQI